MGSILLAITLAMTIVTYARSGRETVYAVQRIKEKPGPVRLLEKLWLAPKRYYIRLTIVGGTVTINITSEKVRIISITAKNMDTFEYFTAPTRGPYLLRLDGYAGSMLIEITGFGPEKDLVYVTGFMALIGATITLWSYVSYHLKSKKSQREK